jgi:nucleoside-diphosphate kinase
MAKEFKSIEKTFLMIKPDGVKRGLVGEIMNRLERIGLKMVAARMIMATREQARKNYPGTDDWLLKMAEKTMNNYKNDTAAVKKDLGTADLLEIGNLVYDGLVNYLTEGPIILTVWEGNHAVDVVRKLVGKTDPVTADVGSIRGDFGFDTPQLAVQAGRIVFKTLVHCSDAPEEAKREIQHWFGENYNDYGDYKRLDYTGIYETLS